MGCVSLPKCYLFQTPGFVVVPHVRKKKEHTLISVSRKPKCVTSTLSATQTDGDKVMKEESGFQSSFGEYLKAMESIKADREKNRDQKEGGGFKKKVKDVASPKHTPTNFRREEFRMFKRSNVSNVGQKDELYEGSRVVADEAQPRGSVPERLAVSPRKEVEYTASKNLRQKEFRMWKRSAVSNVDEKDELHEGSRVVANKARPSGSVPERLAVSPQKEVEYIGSKNLNREEVRKWKRSNVSDVNEKNELYEGSRVDANKAWPRGGVPDKVAVSPRKKVEYIGSKNLKHEEVRMWKRTNVSNVDEKDELYKGSHVVANKAQPRGSVPERVAVSPRKEVEYIQSTNLIPGEFRVWKRSNVSNFDEEKDEMYEGSPIVANKARPSGSVPERVGVIPQKEGKYIGSEDESSKKSYVGTTVVTSSNWKKRMPIDEMDSDSDLEMEKFVFHSSELQDGIHDAPRVSQREMEERIQNLAKRLNEADVEMPAWMFSKTMRSARIKYSDTTIMRVVQILGKLGNWRMVLQVVEWLQTYERFQYRKIRHVYTAALGVLGKARRPVEALNLFLTMQRSISLYPDIVTYHSIAVTLGQAGYMKELFDVIDSMRSLPANFNAETFEEWDPRLEPDLVVYNAVLNGCVMRKEWEGAFWVLEKLAEIDQQPSSTTYGLLMEVMLACGKYDLVHEFFKQMQEFSAPNALTYRVLVNTLWREGKPEEAIVAVQEMESRGIVGSASLYYDLARCLCSVGRVEDALMQVDKICKVASKPLVVTYTGLMQACLDSGKVEDGTFIFNHMQKYCSPNISTCNIILKAYLGHGMFTEAKELFQKMTLSRGRRVSGHFTADIHTFNLMLQACIREDRWDDFGYAYDQMLIHGHPFNTKRHLWMVLQASKAGKVEVVETTWRHLMKSGSIPPPRLVKERFRLKMENDDLKEALSTVASHTSTHQKTVSKEAWLKLLEDNPHCFNREALVHLTSEIDISMSHSELPNPIFQNLRDSCAEILGLDEPVTGRTHVNETPVKV